VTMGLQGMLFTYACSSPTSPYASACFIHVNVETAGTRDTTGHIARGTRDHASLALAAARAARAAQACQRPA
jgi:hypothetical protein